VRLPPTSVNSTQPTRPNLIGKASGFDGHTTTRRWWSGGGILHSSNNCSPGQPGSNSRNATSRPVCVVEKTVSMSTMWAKKMWPRRSSPASNGPTLTQCRDRRSVGQLRTRHEPARQVLDIPPRRELPCGNLDHVAHVDGLLGRRRRRRRLIPGTRVGRPIRPLRRLGINSWPLGPSWPGDFVTMSPISSGYFAGGGGGW
jgi:hypothetical protein